ncbi:uncharacterized protein EV420DRAFT_1486408 [Desarmillaria tabescens]|uniref:Uncharacterized protein n=1 Tax=Armillaria tabescens TaxID=1929756 RepID=A0AA39JDD2_ARMTA|nr:uncharacterized protein EV420DRAFT_1486408 [Desarmillaria tabescens]KAK0439269.1 hypothetical protein EV420DRAFT_1486408 [Desarmillaria tabescens]
MKLASGWLLLLTQVGLGLVVGIAVPSNFLQMGLDFWEEPGRLNVEARLDEHEMDPGPWSLEWDDRAGKHICICDLSVLSDKRLLGIFKSQQIWSKGTMVERQWGKEVEAKAWYHSVSSSPWMNCVRECWGWGLRMEVILKSTTLLAIVPQIPFFFVSSLIWELWLEGEGWVVIYNDEKYLKQALAKC